MRTRLGNARTPESSLGLAITAGFVAIIACSESGNNTVPGPTDAAGDRIVFEDGGLDSAQRDAQTTDGTPPEADGAGDTGDEQREAGDASDAQDAAEPPCGFDVKTGYGALGDGTTDDTASIQAAIDAAAGAGGGVVCVPDGVYAVLGLQLRSKVTLRGVGLQVQLKKNGGGEATHIVDLLGVETATLATVVADSPSESLSLQLSSAGGFAPGDVVLIRDTAHKVTAPYLAGRNQEINRIVSIQPQSVALEHSTLGTYLTSRSAEMVKLDAIEDARIEHLELLLEPGTAGGAIFGDLSEGVVVDGCEVVGPSCNPGIGFDRSTGVQVTDNIIRDGQKQSSGGCGYAIVIGESSHHCLVKGNRVDNVRELPITNNARYIRLEQNTINNPYDSGINTHGSGNKHVEIVNNTVMNSRQYGIAVGWGHHLAADMHIVIEGNRIENSAGRCININAPPDKRNVDISIRDNVLANCGDGSPGTYAVFVGTADQVEVVGNQMYGSDQGGSYGVLFNEGAGFAAEDNTLVRFEYGIRFTNLEGVSVQNNRFNAVDTLIDDLGGNANATVQNNVADPGLPLDPPP